MASNNFSEQSGELLEQDLVRRMQEAMESAEFQQLVEKIKEAEGEDVDLYKLMSEGMTATILEEINQKDLTPAFKATLASATVKAWELVKEKFPKNLSVSTDQQGSEKKD